MDVKQQNIEAMNTLASVYDSPRAKAILGFAKKRGIESATVAGPDGTAYAASMYAWQLYCNADLLAGSAPEDAETYQVVSIMSALEESAEDSWSYGTKLIYDMRAAGVGPTRKETTIFLAMEDGWHENKSELLACDPTTVYFYCGKLVTLYNSLPGVGPCFEQHGSPVNLPERMEPVLETVERITREYGGACVGEGKMDKLEAFLKLLRKWSDFYTAPCAGSYEDGSLAKHTLDVAYKLVTLAKPTTSAQAGACVLAALGHDIAEAHVITKRGKDGTVVFDTMPYGHGRKSLYIMGAFLDDCLSVDIASAIDAHMHDIAANPKTPLQMMASPLGLYLHIADVICTFVDENK